jgi:hypothetical protein
LFPLPFQWQSPFSIQRRLIRVLLQQSSPLWFPSPLQSSSMRRPRRSLPQLPRRQLWIRLRLFPRWRQRLPIRGPLRLLFPLRMEWWGLPIRVQVPRLFP